MSSRTFEPLELIPTDAVPSTDVLGAGRNPERWDPNNRDYSDLFPNDHYRHFQGTLGLYSGGDPLQGHPLYAATQGLYAAYYAFANQERQNDFQCTEATSRGLMSTMLQNHIGRCIAKGYDNLVKQSGPTNATETIALYIEGQDIDRAAVYNDELNYHTNLLASLDRGDEAPTPTEIDGIPVISGRDFALALGEVPESPEVEHEQSKTYTEEQISIVRKRLVRLRFEYMSATALTELLSKAIS